MTHRFATVAVAAVLALSLAGGAWAQAVLQTVTVRVKPGQMPTYLERVAALQKVLDRVGGEGRTQVWNTLFAGTGVGDTLVVVGYPSLAAFAEGTTKSQADPEWQRIIAGLDGVRTLVSQGLMASRDGGGVPPQAESGAVLQGVLVRVEPGQLDTYLARVEALKEVQERLGTTATIRVWQATFSGESTGTVAVGVTHPSLVAYAANTAKLEADAEWQKLMQGLDAIRTVVSTSLFVSP